MRPDLFAGPAQRDDSHRILARLANGGNGPPAARQWGNLTSGPRARLAAVAALLAVIAATWMGLQDVGTPPVIPVAMTPERVAPAYPSTPQAATIVNEPGHAAPAAAQPPAVATTVLPELRVARPRDSRPAVRARTPHREAPAEGDDDVTLLTAMLKHANGQKPAATPPGDR